MNWTRARKPEQKAERREEILAAAARLFSQREYDDISLNEIARAANVSKANVYRYFATREEIFLTIFSAERESFVRSLIARVPKIRSKDPVNRIAEIWVEESLKHPRLLALLPRLMISLEKNSSLEQLTEFKRQGRDYVGDLVAALVKAYPELDADRWMFVVHCSAALMAGLWPLTNPAEVVREAMELADVDHEPWQYEPLMKEALVSLIRGQQNNRKRK